MTVKRDNEFFWFGLAIGLATGFLFGVVAARALCAQEPKSVLGGHGSFNYGYVEDSARVELEQAWDDRNPFQLERGYCIEPSDFTVDTASGGNEWIVHRVRPPVSIELQTPYAIEFHCGPNAVASGHIHTPASCAHDPTDPLGKHPKMCIIGGHDSALCSVDEADRMGARNDAFMFVQCDKHAFVFYWPNKRG